jgi:hypothetical protein
MTARFEDKPGPFTYRQRKDCWEVLVIREGVFERYIECRTEEHAKAVANFRVFQHRWAYQHVYDDVCDLPELEKSLAVLPEYGIDDNCFGYRQCRRLAEQAAA